MQPNCYFLLKSCLPPIDFTHFMVSLPLPTTSYHLSPHPDHLPHLLPPSPCPIYLPDLPPPRISFSYLPYLPSSSTSPIYLLHPPPPSTSTILLHLLPPSTSPNYFRQRTCTSPISSSIHLHHLPPPFASSIHIHLSFLYEPGPACHLYNCVSSTGTLFW